MSKLQAKIADTAREVGFPGVVTYRIRRYKGRDFISWMKQYTFGFDKRLGARLLVRLARSKQVDMRYVAARTTATPKRLLEWLAKPSRLNKSRKIIEEAQETLTRSKRPS